MKTDFEKTMLRSDMEKLAAQFGFSRQEAAFVLAAQAAFNGQPTTFFLQRFNRRDLVKVARAGSALRDAAFGMGGTKRLEVKRKTTPKTGQALAIRLWLSNKSSGFQFFCSDAHRELNTFTLQQIQNAVAFDVKGGTIKIVRKKHGYTPALYEKI